MSNLLIFAKKINMGSLFKTSLALFVLFLIAILFIGYFLPKNEEVLVSKVVKCDINQSYTMVNQLKNWEKWSPWFEKDPTMKLTYSDSTSGVGAFYSWVGDKEDNFGKMTVTNTVENSQIDLSLNYTDRGETPCKFKFISVENGTQIDWSMKAGYSDNWFIKNFLGGYGYMMMNFFLNKDFSKGLTNIDNQCKS